MPKVDYLLKISRMSDAHIPISGLYFSTSTQLQAQTLRNLNLHVGRTSSEFRQDKNLRHQDRKRAVSQRVSVT
jgi:hypothetical protein